MATFMQRPLALLALLGAIALLGFTWTRVVTTITDAQPVVSKGRPTAIVWADRVFDDRALLARFLRSRGTTYAEWSRHHPMSAATIEHRRFRPPAERTTIRNRNHRAKPAPTATAAPTIRTTAAPGHAARRTTAATNAHEHPIVSWRVVRDGVLTLLLTLALMLALAATFPARVFGRFPALASRVGQQRGNLAVASAAIVAIVTAVEALSDRY